MSQWVETSARELVSTPSSQPENGHLRKKRWSLNISGCLIEVNAWVGLCVFDPWVGVFDPYKMGICRYSIKQVLEMTICLCCQRDRWRHCIRVICGVTRREVRLRSHSNVWFSLDYCLYKSKLNMFFWAFFMQD
jgi:hypothetical protein